MRQLAQSKIFHKAYKIVQEKKKMRNLSELIKLVGLRVNFASELPSG